MTVEGERYHIVKFVTSNFRATTQESRQKDREKVQQKTNRNVDPKINKNVDIKLDTILDTTAKKLIDIGEHKSIKKRFTQR